VIAKVHRDALMRELGEKCYPDLASIPDRVEMVDVFRRSEYLPEVVEAAIAKGARSTWFLAAGNPVTARKKWIAGSLEPRGTLFIDAGAVTALRRGNSLLPVGVARIDGDFARGDAVIIRGPDGAEIGRGLSAYDAEDAQKIRGRPSTDIDAILGFSGRAEMIHRDNLVVGRD